MNPIDDTSLAQPLLNKLQWRYAAKKMNPAKVVPAADVQRIQATEDGVIRSVFSHVSPLGVRAEAFGVPTELESRHDFLWRIHAKAPARGEMVIFNRSHYEDVLVTRVRGLIDEETCQQRYNHILHFESLLHNAGISVLKCYLHISKSEQKKRLQARLDDPRKHWKLQASDFDDRGLWPQFTAQGKVVGRNAQCRLRSVCQRRQCGRLGQHRDRL